MRVRIASLALVLAFQGVAAADAFGLHECPHHDALPEAPRQEMPHGAHADYSRQDDAHGPAEDGHGEHGPCTCVGTCQVQPQSTPIAAALVRPSLPGGQITEAEAPIARREALPGRPSFLLPYAQGPPSNRSV